MACDGPTARLAGNQAETGGDSVMVAINGERGAAELTEEEHGGAGFGSDAGEGFEPGAGIGNREIGKEFKREISVAEFADPSENLLDSWCFLFGPGAVSDRGFDFSRRGVADSRPFGKALAKLSKGAARIGVPGSVREHGADQFAQGIKGPKEGDRGSIIPGKAGR